MTDIAKVIQEVIATNVPVLCADTCTLLDLMRDPSRGKFSEHDANAALDLLHRGEARPCAIRVVLTELVEEELAKNRKAVADETERQLRRIDANVTEILKLFVVYGVTLPNIGLSRVGFEKIGAGFVDRFLRIAVILSHPAGMADLALHRVRNTLAPAKRGKDSTKDCVIVESYVELLKRLRSAGFTNKAVFFTTNTEDFCAPGSSDLHPDLKNEFAGCGLELAVRFGHAHHLLT